MKILIDNGHGEDTPGKRSPDGRFREYRYAREMADLILSALWTYGYDAELVVPEMRDIPLKERCRRVNRICDRFGKDNVILVSLHVNAAGNGKEWKDATGWQCHTSPGQTDSDILAECLYRAAGRNLSGRKIRRDLRDGDSDFENRYYILKHTKCAAVLTENFFQDSRRDVEYLESEEGKKEIMETHVSGIIEYVEKYGKESKEHPDSSGPGRYGGLRDGEKD